MLILQKSYLAATPPGMTMHDKRTPICALPAKSKLVGALRQRFVEAEQTGRDKDDADREQQ
jgi:hypothetical protein